MNEKSYTTRTASDFARYAVRADKFRAAAFEFYSREPGFNHDGKGDAPATVEYWRLKDHIAEMVQTEGERVFNAPSQAQLDEEVNW